MQNQNISQDLFQIFLNRQLAEHRQTSRGLILNFEKRIRLKF